MNKTFIKALSISALVAGTFVVNSAQAACGDITRAQLQSAISTVVGANSSAGFNLPMWLTFVDETGKVCDVVTSGTSGALASRSEWLGSRVISAQKANTANAFSLNGVSISSGALYAAVQPGASLYGLQESNPVDASVAYKGLPATFGTASDPLKGKRIGGINVFGGGLAVYNGANKIGAIGVSGDTSCTDHAVAWQVRGLIAPTPPLADFPAAGGFETLNITNSYAALGDHPDCPLSVNGGTTLDGNAVLGYK